MSVSLLASIILALVAADAGLNQPKGSAENLDPHGPYQAERLNPVRYEVDLSFVVTAPYRTKKLEVWVPLPPNDLAQTVSGRQLSTFPIEVEPTIGREPLYGNEFAYFQFDSPQGAQIIRHQFAIEVWELRWRFDASKVAPVAHWPESFAPFLRNEPQAVVVDDRFRKLLADVLPSPRGDARDLESVMRWINGRMKYDHGVSSLEASSVHALEKSQGHCSDYHGLCASMGRVLGYPTRVTYGINPLPKNSPSHCKLEVFLPPYGWVSFDLSETQKLVAAIAAAPSLGEEQRETLSRRAMERLLSGFRDNTWFLQTRGTDYELAPPASRRVALVRTIYVEADGVPLPDPDPANRAKREFAWMTVHHYRPDRPVSYPFQDWTTLEEAD